MSAKKLKIEYGDSVFALPREKLLLTLPSAGAIELKVLILAASNDAVRSDYGAACSQICKQLDITETAFRRAVEFWNDAGVLNIGERETAAKAPAESAPTVQRKILQSNSMPTYTEGQTADIIEAHTELAGIIDACQQIAEKMFTPNEVQSIIGMYDHLGLSDAGYIETLYLYCKSQGKASPRYVEKVAIGLYDSDITTTSALNSYIKRKEECDDMIARFRALIGAGDRSLTAKEKKLIECWISEWGLDIDVITRAYEVTVDNIGEYKPAYMNRVLENWYNSGLTTLQAVEASLETYQKNKAAASGASADFNEDEYFEAALARSARYLEKKRSENNSEV